MSVRLLNDVGERRVVEKQKFVSETRKDVILSKRGEARIYRANRTFLWAKSLGASTQATNSLVNLSYGVLQTINDIQALFSAGNFVRSVAARYAWTIGGRALSKVQSKIVPQGGGIIGRAMRVQAGRQSKKILSSMSSNFFVKTEIEIKNVVNMEKHIKNQLTQGKGLARQWALMTAANAVSNAPDPYTQAQKIMGNNQKKGLKKSLDGNFMSDQNYLKDSTIFGNIFSQTMNVSEAQHYKKFLATGRNPNDYFDAYRNKIIEMNDAYDKAQNPYGPTYVKNMKTGELGYQKNLVDEINKLKNEANNKYGTLKDATDIIENPHGLDITKSADRKIMNMGTASIPYQDKFTVEDFDRILNGSATYTNKYNAYYDLTHSLNSLSRARQEGVKPGARKPLGGGPSAVAYRAQKGGKEEAKFMDMLRKAANESWYNSSMSNAIIDKALGTKGFGTTYREMLHIETGNRGVPFDGLFVNGRLNPIYEGRNLGYQLFKSSNNPKDPNYIPSRDQIQRAIHIDNEKFKVKDAFLRISVSFGGRTAQSKFADAISDAQEIEYGGIQKSKSGIKTAHGKNGNDRTYRYTYPRTLFMHQAAYSAAKSLGLNFGMTQPKVTKHQIRGKFYQGETTSMEPKQKQKAFNLMLDRKTKEILNAELDIRRKTDLTGRVSIRDAYETILYDPEGTRYNAPLFRNKELIQESVRKITSPANRRSTIMFDDAGNPQVVYEDTEQIGGGGYKNYFDSLNDALKSGNDVGAAIRANRIWQSQFKQNLNEIFGGIGADLGDEVVWYARFSDEMASRYGVTSIEDIVENIQANVSKARRNYIESAQIQSNDRLKKGRAKREQDAMEFAAKNGKNSKIEAETLYKTKLQELEEAADIEEYITLTNQLKDFPYQQVWDEMEEAELDRLRRVYDPKRGRAATGKKVTLGEESISLKQFMGEFTEGFETELKNVAQRISKEQNIPLIDAYQTSEFLEAQERVINDYQILANQAGITFEVGSGEDISGVFLQKRNPATGEYEEFSATINELMRSQLEGLESKYRPKQADRGRNDVLDEIDTSQGAFGSTTQKTNAFGDNTFEEAMQLLEGAETLIKAVKQALQNIEKLKPQRRKGMPTFGGGLGVVVEGGQFYSLIGELGRKKMTITNDENSKLRNSLATIVSEIENNTIINTRLLAMYLWGYKSSAGSSLDINVILGGINGSFRDVNLPAYINQGITTNIQQDIDKLNKELTKQDALVIYNYLFHKINLSGLRYK